MKRTLISLLLVVVIISFGSYAKDKKAMIEKKSFGTLADGREATLYTLTNAVGSQVKITNFGAVVVSLIVPDKDGKFGNVVLGYDTIQGYEHTTTYFGAIVGRYGNRIGKAQFTIDGQTYHVTPNDGGNSLHGGRIGFNKVLWNVVGESSSKEPSLKLQYVSRDGEEGFPGTVTLTVTYTFTNKNELKIDYTGKTDKATVLNPTNHSYFNLSGDFTNTILDELVTIESDSTTPVAKGLIPTGVLASVENTPFDFRKPTAIGARINADDEQIKLGGGYDHNWVIRKYNKKVRKAAEVYDTKSGRVLTVLTDQPGLQFYTGNFLNGHDKGNGVSYQRRTGLCMEAQGFPDTPNKPQFPSVTLRPGKVYHQTTIYQFTTK